MTENTMRVSWGPKDIIRKQNTIFSYQIQMHW